MQSKTGYGDQQVFPSGNRPAPGSSLYHFSCLGLYQFTVQMELQALYPAETLFKVFCSPTKGGWGFIWCQPINHQLCWWSHRALASRKNSQLEDEKSLATILKCRWEFTEKISQELYTKRTVKAIACSQAAEQVVQVPVAQSACKRWSVIAPYRGSTNHRLSRWL